MSKNDIKNYIELMMPYINKYVAVNKDETEVIADGVSIVEVEKKLQKNNKKAAYIEYILPFNTLYAPHSK